MSYQPKFVDDPSLIDKIAESLSGHCTLRLAAVRAGISPVTLKEWLWRGAAGEDPYTLVWDRVGEALGSSVTRLTDKIAAATDKAGNPDWKACAYLLDRQESEIKTFAGEDSQKGPVVIQLGKAQMEPLLEEDVQELKKLSK